MQSRKAFTLMELLVVVAIVGFLAALAVPATQKALRSARSAACVNNVRQLAQATITYANDHDQWMPAYESTSEIARIVALLSGGYIPDRKIMICPVNRAAGQKGLTNPSQGATWTNYYSMAPIVRTDWRLVSGPYVPTPKRTTEPGAYKIPIVWDQRADADSGINKHKRSPDQPGGVFGYLDGSAVFLSKPESVLRK